MTKRKKLTTFQYLRAQMHNLLSTAACAAAYQSWDANYCKSALTKVYNGDAARPKVTVAGLRKLTERELLILGIRYWDTKNGLMVLPLWLFPFLKTKQKLTSISGREVVTGADKIDLDVRLGCIAFGFRRKR